MINKSVQVKILPSKWFELPLNGNKLVMRWKLFAWFAFPLIVKQEGEWKMLQDEWWDEFF